MIPCQHCGSIEEPYIYSTNGGAASECVDCGYIEED